MSSYNLPAVGLLLLIISASAYGQSPATSGTGTMRKVTVDTPEVTEAEIITTLLGSTKNKEVRNVVDLFHIIKNGRLVELTTAASENQRGPLKCIRPGDVCYRYPPYCCSGTCKFFVLAGICA